MVTLIHYSNILTLLIAISILIPGCTSEEDQQVTIPETSPGTEIVLLEFENYLGNSQNIHPKVLYFENGWQGYEFWMAYTPYPNGFTYAENPCLAVSHDGINWGIPFGLTNPLALTPKNGYNSDTHLVYDEGEDRMEIWWRPYDLSMGDKIVRSLSNDGVIWSEPETVMDYNDKDCNRLSPAIWIEDGKYLMIYSDGRNLWLTSADNSDSEFQWSDPEILPIEWGELGAWHQDIIQNNDGSYELIVCAYEKGVSTNNLANLYYLWIDSDLEYFSTPKLLIERGKREKDFDHRSIYRSSIVKVNGKTYIYYSAIDEYWKRHMALKIFDSWISYQ